MKRLTGGAELVAVICAFLVAGAVQCRALQTPKGFLGVYAYETLEGRHTVSSAAGTELANAFIPLFAKVTTSDKVPLTSNETVRILEAMTKDRKIVVTTLSAWLAGGVIAAPTITLADDSMKFKDLTWHVDEDSVLADAKRAGMTSVIIGTFTGMANPIAGTGEAAKNLRSVNVLGNIRLIDVKQGGVVWAKTYRRAKADFDSRLAFNGAVLEVADSAAKDIKEALQQTK
jgi:hypothetical protein